MRKPCCISICSLAFAAVFAGCDKASAPPESQTVSWTSTTIEQLDESATAQLARALEARNEMEATLKSSLLASIKADGPQGAVGVCSTIAPEIASELSTKHGLTIGRTSFKLRNPTNAPPAWMEWVVEVKQKESAYFIKNDGTLAVSYPIMIAPACMLCHGNQDTISAQTQESISTHYPDDQATGFALDELRGWFWVEVPTSD